ncbi:hypothetical protein [Streptomyces tubercidicus]|uniref:hypothetical protein n=1 Tax=Streptomyces tubercidicus TaxID=47759 RepID=UPI00369AA7CF
MTPRRFLVLLPVVALTASGCAIGPSGVMAVDRPATGIRTTASLYFLGPAGPTPVVRQVAGPTTAEAAVNTLFAGPSPSEQARGLSTEVPISPRLVRAKAGTGKVDLVLPVDVSALSPLAVSQIVCTAVSAQRSTDPTPITIGITIHGGGGFLGPLYCAGSRPHATSRPPEPSSR